MRQWKNEDLYRESGRQGPPWCDERRDARPRRVGGGCRDGSWDHTREGGCSSGSGSSCSRTYMNHPTVRGVLAFQRIRILLVTGVSLRDLAFRIVGMSASLRGHVLRVVVITVE